MASSSPHQHQAPPAHQARDDQEDLLSAPAGLWLPATVVKRDRNLATILWVTLLAGFLANAISIVWEAMEARANPSTSSTIKKEAFNFPDLAICINKDRGCRGDLAVCSDGMDVGVYNHRGFMEDDMAIEANNASLAIQVEFPNCRVLPVSKLTLNQTGIDNGDITQLGVSIMGMWREEPKYVEFNDIVILYSQLVDVYFIDADAGPEGLRRKGTAVDATLPFDRQTPLDNVEFITTRSHMVIDYEEFTGISRSDRPRETQNIYTQRTTSGPVKWISQNPVLNGELTLAILLFDMVITTFQYNSVEEVDPMDVWTILGAIGGSWQYVVMVFGIFFVYSEKKVPEYKMRNLVEAVKRPARLFQQDIAVDATSENLPREWVKKRRPDGSMYYFNVTSGMKTNMSPSEISQIAPPPSYGTGFGFLREDEAEEFRPIMST